MQQYLIKSDHIFIEFEKALYWDKIYLRDKYVNHAIKYKIPIEIKMGKKTFIIEDVVKWKKTGEKMLKEFKRKGQPMTLWGNFLKLDWKLPKKEEYVQVSLGMGNFLSGLTEKQRDHLRKLLHKK